MTRMVIYRLGQAVISLFFLIIIVFPLVRMTGDPARFLLPQEATADQRAQLRERLGLDEPLPVQFIAYVGQLARGDLGISYRTYQPVSAAIIERLPATAAMGGAALVLILAFGIPLGIYAAYWQGGVLDGAARLTAALGQSVPNFWLGLILLLIFAVTFRLLPAGGYGGVQHLILPAVTLAFGTMAGLIRLLRSSMIEVLSSDYVLNLRLKGLPESAILWKHALRNAGLTTLSFIGIIIAGLLTGSVLVETIFNWPGVGRLMIDGIRNRDFAVVQGGMLFFAATYIGVNLIVDVLCLVLNPRLR